MTPTLQFKTEASKYKVVPYFYELPTDDNTENVQRIFDLTEVLNYRQENQMDSIISEAPGSDEDVVTA